LSEKPVYYLPAGIPITPGVFQALQKLWYREKFGNRALKTPFLGNFRGFRVREGRRRAKTIVQTAGRLGGGNKFGLKC
jgi:hypothetical protein